MAGGARGRSASGIGRLILPAALLVAGTLTGCTPAGAPDGTSTAGSAGPPPSSESATPVATSAAPPAGHYDAECRQGQTDAKDFDPTRQVISLDPLFIRDNFSGSATPQFDGTVQWMKDPFFVRAGRTVTVTVAPDQQAKVGLVAQYGAREGNTSITFTSCPASVTPYTWWPGGFLVHGSDAVCLRLTVAVAGAEGVRKPVIPAGDIACPASW
ncbi:hypothetical protein [Arthrobacter woluwensis]|uniref:hypothetical protein n=1 Tax=Arthrobacter woluwensis TaxID=156980 RepID=UPI003810F56D